MVLGRPVAFDKVGWLISEAQLVFLIFGVIVIVLKKKNPLPLPQWRSTANIWVGRVMVVTAAFYVIAFGIVAYLGP